MRAALTFLCLSLGCLPDLSTTLHIIIFASAALSTWMPRRALTEPAEAPAVCWWRHVSHLRPPLSIMPGRGIRRLTSMAGVMSLPTISWLSGLDGTQPPLPGTYVELSISMGAVHCLVHCDRSAWHQRSQLT